MSKEVLLYGHIYSFSASEFIESINEAATDDIIVRVNSDGGEVRYGYGMIAKFSELKGKKLLKNDGEANSMAAFFFCYADDAEAIDTAEFTFHRAGYPSWIESNPEYFDEDTKAGLVRMNTNLRKAFEGKINIEAFEKLKGVKVKDLFSMDGRLDVTLTAKEAKDIGLINRVITITPKKKAEIEANLEAATAKHNGLKAVAKSENKNENKNTMTLDQLKSEHPTVYASAIEIGVNQGVAKEKSRVEVWAHYAEVDAKAAKEGIASGKEITQLQIIEFTEKKFSAGALKEIKEDSAEKIKTLSATAEKTKEQLELEAFEKKVDERK